MKNQHGQLGDGTNIDRHTPVPIALSSNVKVVAIAAGQFHSVILTDTGDVYTFGSNQFGQLGYSSKN